MTTATQPKPVAAPAPKAEYKMPEVRLGDVVYWYHGGQPSDEPLPAIVTRIGNRSLCLSLVYSNNYNLVVRDGVRHLADPGTKDNERIENGAWGYSAAQMELMKLKAQVAELQELVTQPKK